MVDRGRFFKREKTCKIYGGEGEIRTRGTLSGTSAFEAGAFNHSATSPRRCRAEFIREMAEIARPLLAPSGNLDNAPAEQ